MLMLVAMLTFATAAVDAQVIVRVRPDRPHRVIMHRPMAPSPRHVWVEEDWVPQGRSYAWHGGYWAAPPRAGAIYIPGHWQNTRRGSVWIPGHWR